MTRTFREVAMCHLPDNEIGLVQTMIDEGLTSAYKNDAGFFVWTGGKWLSLTAPVLLSILARNKDVDYVLFDVDVEPDETMPIFEGWT